MKIKIKKEKLRKYIGKVLRKFVRLTVTYLIVGTLIPFVNVDILKVSLALLKYLTI